MTASKKNQKIKWEKVEKREKKRGRPLILKPHIEKIISSRVSADQAKPPAERTPRKVLAYEIQREIIQQGEEKPPELSTLEKRISFHRSVPKNPFDELWSLGSLAQHPISPDAMPIVMSIYKKTLAGHGELTIREAQWIARLYKIIDDAELLWDWAWAYAMDEWLSEITNRPFDTTELDLELVRNPQYAQESRRDTERAIAIWGIAERLHPDFRGPGADFDALFSAVTADFSALMELNLSIEEIEEIAKSGKYKKEAQNEGECKAKK